MTGLPDTKAGSLHRAAPTTREEAEAGQCRREELSDDLDPLPEAGFHDGGAAGEGLQHVRGDRRSDVGRILVVPRRRGLAQIDALRVGPRRCDIGPPLYSDDGQINWG